MLLQCMSSNIFFKLNVCGLNPKMWISVGEFHKYIDDKFIPVKIYLSFKQKFQNLQVIVSDT